MCNQRNQFPDYVLGDDELNYLVDLVEGRSDLSARRIFGVVTALQGQLKQHRKRLNKIDADQLDHVALSTYGHGSILDCQFCDDHIRFNADETDYEVLSPAVPFRGLSIKLLAATCEDCGACLAELEED